MCQMGKDQTEKSKGRKEMNKNDKMREHKIDVLFEKENKV